MPARRAGQQAIFQDGIYKNVSGLGSFRAIRKDSYKSIVVQVLLLVYPI